MPTATAPTTTTATTASCPRRETNAMTTAGVAAAPPDPHTTTTTTTEDANGGGGGSTTSFDALDDRRRMRMHGRVGFEESARPMTPSEENSIAPILPPAADDAEEGGCSSSSSRLGIAPIVCHRDVDDGRERQAEVGSMSGGLGGLSRMMLESGLCATTPRARQRRRRPLHAAVSREAQPMQEPGRGQGPKGTSGAAGTKGTEGGDESAVDPDEGGQVQQHPGSKADRMKWAKHRRMRRRSDRLHFHSMDPALPRRDAATTPLRSDRADARTGQLIATSSSGTAMSRPEEATPLQRRSNCANDATGRRLLRATTSNPADNAPRRDEAAPPRGDRAIARADRLATATEQSRPCTTPRDVELCRAAT